MDAKTKVKGKSLDELSKLAKQGKLEGWSDEIASEVYHKGPGVGSHGLMKILHSPRKFMHAMQHPTVPSDAMIFGSMFHHSVLEPDTFDLHWVAKPVGTDRRTKAGKEAYEAFEAASQGKTIVHHEDMEQCKAMRDRVLTHPKFCKMLETGRGEITFYAPYAAFDTVVCRARADLYVPKTGAIIDLKTTDDATPEAFAKTIVNYKYHLQAAYYLDVVKSAGLQADHFIFAVIEKTPPFEMALYYLSPRTIEAGRVLYQSALETYASCLAEESWPGLPEEIMELEAPEWHLRKFGNPEVEEF